MALDSRSSGVILAACLLAGVAVPAWPQQLPPPEPPPRPESLRGPRPEAATPPLAADAPLPPERPDALKPAPVAGGPIPSPAPDRNPPLPPERPSELKAEQEPPAPSMALPAPPARPVELGATPPLSVTVMPSEAPLPPQRPADLVPAEGEASAESAPLPPERPAELSGDSTETAILAAPEDTACLARLDALGVVTTKQPPILKGQCSVAHPLTLRAIKEDGESKAVALTADQTVVCTVAEGLGGWVKEVRAAAEKELGDRLAGLDLGGGYVCRGQNHVGEAKLSEHAFANAIDVMGFSFGKHAPLAVGFLPENSPEAKFLDSVRASACRHFRTVLGPGSNETHANHLHFDQRDRPNGHRLCELRPSGPDAQQSAKAGR